MRQLLVDIFQIAIGFFAVISAGYYFVNFFVKNSRHQLLTFQEYEKNFNILERQIDLLKQNQAYQNQLILEKLSNLSEKVSDIENWLDKHEELSFIKRRRD